MGAETVRIAVPGAAMVVVERETLSPAGNVELTRVTIPEKLFRIVTEIVEVQDDPPASKDRPGGLVETSKSGPLTRTGRKSVALNVGLNAVTTR